MGYTAGTAHTGNDSGEVWAQWALPWAMLSTSAGLDVAYQCACVIYTLESGSTEEIKIPFHLLMTM